MKPHRRAILLGCDHRDLELARQEREFGMEARPLPQQLGIGARIDKFVGRRSGILVARYIADAIAARLDRMHLDGGEIGENVGRVLELDPVILDILPRREMSVIAIVLARDMREHPHLCGVQRAIGDGDAQHIGVKLEIEAVHQPERLELILCQLAGKAPLDLVAKLGDARVDHFLVVIVVSVHVRSPSFRRRGRAAKS